MKTIFLLFVFLIGHCNLNFAQKNAEQIYEQYNDAIVRIYTYNDNNIPQSQGSGVIIKSKNWVITNLHVATNATILYAEHNGKYMTLDSIIAFDEKQDILILHIAKTDNVFDLNLIPDIKIGDSDKLKIGQKIFAIGSPYGLENTITEGIISGKRISNENKQGYIQISAPISSGSSGGAILNTKGELIGISTLVLTGETAQNLNFAILINDVVKVAKTGGKIIEQSKLDASDKYYKIGYSDFLERNYLSAIINFEKAANYTPILEKKGMIYFNIGVCYDAITETDSAILYYGKSISLFSYANSNVALGNIYYKKKDYERAITNFTTAIAINPTCEEAYVGLGLSYFAYDDYSESTTYLKKVLSFNPYNYNALYLLGQISFKLKKIDVAIYFYSSAINAYADYAEAYLALANCYLELNETDKAIGFQQKAYKLKPELKNKKD
jgi:tetratricopeptide (TPR) repeat protein